MSGDDGTISLAEAKRRRAGGGAGAPPTSGQWQDELVRSENGMPKALLLNAVTAFRKAPEWSGVLGYDVFRQKTVRRCAPPWIQESVRDQDWQDHDDLLAATWLQENKIAVGPDVAAQAIEVVARESSFHPVQEYLSSLKWDGKRRINNWLTYYLGVDESDYSKAVGECWLKAAVARVFRPGCKVDTAIVLEGGQGKRKSTAIGVLGAPWVTDELADFGSKDAAMQIAGVWIVEIAELEGMSRVNVAKVKAFMSRAIDRFRPPWGHRVIEIKRQCVFAGSVNENDYLRDVTGGRRFWPVECKSIDIDALAIDRDQLWAEARLRFEAGDSWWLRDPVLEHGAARQQQARYREDPWQPMISDYVAKRVDTINGVVVTNGKRVTVHEKREQKYDKTGPYVTIDEVLRRELRLGADQFGNIDVSKWKQADSNRVAACLKNLGWKRAQLRIDGARDWVYFPPSVEASPDEEDA